MARVYGLFADGPAAEAAVKRLDQAGFPREGIGLLTPGEAHEPDPLRASTFAAAGAGGVGAVAGGLLGAAATGLIPGVGPVIAAGSLVPMLIGIATGAGAGATAGGLFGAPAGGDASNIYYEQEVAAGRTMLTVEAGERAQEAVVLLREAGAVDSAPMDSAA